MGQIVNLRLLQGACSEAQRTMSVDKSTVVCFAPLHTPYSQLAVGFDGGCFADAYNFWGERQLRFYHSICRWPLAHGFPENRTLTRSG